MSDEAIVQYLGFEAKALARVYTFAVLEVAGDPLQYTLSISNEAFVTHRARYQDAPEICSLRLRRELVASANHPPTNEFFVSDAELADYQDMRRPKVTRKFQKPAQAD